MRIGRGLAAAGGLALLALLAYLILAPGPLAINEVTHGSALSVSAPRRWVTWTPDCVPLHWDLTSIQAVYLRTLDPQDEEGRIGEGEEVVCGYDQPRLEVTLADGATTTIEVAPVLTAQPLFWLILGGALALLWPGRAWALLRAGGRWFRPRGARQWVVRGAGAEVALVLRVTGKATLLFAAANLIFALLNPVAALGQLSLYNLFFVGRERLPFSNDPAQAYNLTMDNLAAMFASHIIATPKAPDEYRVLLLGDSATWGWELRPEETLAGQLNAAGLHTADGRRVRVYNVAYPLPSLSKDLLLITYGLRYAPDLILWPVTLYSLESDQVTPLERNQPELMQTLIETLQLDPARFEGRLHLNSLMDRTVVAERQPLNELLRLQFYGLMWSVTGIDQRYHPTGRQINQPLDETAPEINTPDLGGFDLLAAGMALAEPIPVLIINEPIFIQANDANTDQLNAFYSRTAYETYRGMLDEIASARGWAYADLWDSIDPAEFTDSPLHYSPEGACQFAAALAPALLELANSHLDDTL